MPEKIKEVTPPRGLARLLFRLPIWLYRLGLGGLLGDRFMLLTHIGRKSGLKRHTMLEVVRYDKEKNTFIAAAGFGPQSDWYRNIHVNPHVTVQTSQHTWQMTAYFLKPEQAGKELLDYAQRYPLALRELSRFMGYRLDGTQDDIRAMGHALPMVAFKSQ